ncbi:hypothetical protein ACW5F0_12420 [Luteimonas sp. A534]
MPPASLASRAGPTPGRILAALLASAGVQASAAAADGEANNGTDPTRLTTTAVLAYEYNDLAPGGSRHAPRFDLTIPFGDGDHSSVRLRVPAVRNDVLGNRGFGLGDVSIMGTHVFGLTPQRGMVVQGELVFDTASRPELGTGRNVYKGTFIYAKFLRRGIFAPAIVHSIDLGGDSGRTHVNTTSLDFYYVPRLANPKLFVTIDPSLTFDWENDRRFPSLAVTMGTAVGPMFGGLGQVYIKPTLLGGSDRPGDWSIEVGFKVLGF